MLVLVAFIVISHILRLCEGNLPFSRYTSDEYVLLSDNAFFEFLKPDEKEPVDVEGLQEGEEYEVILTNAAGLYRYRLGDVIRILRRENGAPVFTFEYRMDNRLRLSNVTLTEKMLEKAVEVFEKQTDTDLRDFCAMIDEDGAGSG